MEYHNDNDNDNDDYYDYIYKYSNYYSPYYDDDECDATLWALVLLAIFGLYCIVGCCCVACGSTLDVLFWGTGLFCVTMTLFFGSSEDMNLTAAMDVGVLITVAWLLSLLLVSCCCSIRGTPPLLHHTTTPLDKDELPLNCGRYHAHKNFPFEPVMASLVVVVDDDDDDVCHCHYNSDHDDDDADDDDGATRLEEVESCAFEGHEEVCVDPETLVVHVQQAWPVADSR